MTVGAFNPVTYQDIESVQIVDVGSSGQLVPTGIIAVAAPAGNTISFPTPSSVVYGVAPFSISSDASASSGLPVSYTVLFGPGSLNGTTLTVTGAGTIFIEATQAGNSSYLAAVPVIQTLTVTPAGLSVTATNASKTYGQADPPLTFTYSGLVNGDTSASFIGTETYSGGPGVGSYTISRGTLAATGNYSITHFTTGTFTINPAPLTVTASNESKVYDNNSATDPALAYTYAGLANGDSSASFTGSLSRATGETVGAYAINQGSLAATGNYTIGTFFPATFTITPANSTMLTSQMISFPAPSSVVYGTTPFSISSAASASSGLPVSYTVLSGPGSLNGTTMTVTGAGTIIIEATQAGNNTYLAATPVIQTLTVTPAGLSVTATNASKTYGQADPSLTFTYSGLVNGDTAASFIGAETYSGGPGVGSYTISQGTLAATGNYTITHFTTGTFTINPAPLTVTASNQSKVWTATT